MSRYNIFQAIYMSFYSKKLYKDVAENWGGKAFFYLLILIALSWIGQTIVIQSAINHVYSQGSELIASQIPLLEIKDGKLSTPQKKPYVIKDPDEDGSVFAIIDTSGKYTRLGEKDGALLITQTQVITKPNANETRVYQIPKAFNASLNPITINDYIKEFVGFLWIFIFCFLVFLSYVYRIIQALFYAVIGKIFSKVSGANVLYGKIIQITLVAITPAVVLATVLDLLAYSFPHQNLTYFVISMCYMIYGIWANKQQTM